MKKKYKMILVLLIIAITFSCNPDNNQENIPKPKKMPLVKVETAAAIKMVSFIEITGTIQANIFTDIKSPADGIIESLMARENQRVEKDQIIAVINPTDRVSLISNNELETQQIEEKLKATNKNSDEYKELLKEFEKAKESLEYAKKMYQTIPVICPMNGLVTQRWTDIGSQVGAKDKIVTVSDMNSLVIKAEVNEKYFEAIKQGKKIPVILNAYPSDTLSGIISLVYPQVASETRSVKFDIKILNFNKKLLPGMTAVIKLVTSIHKNALVISDDVLLTDVSNKPFIFRIDSNSIAHQIYVIPGLSSNGFTEILSGLSENDIIVVKGQEMLKDGKKVKIAKSKYGSKK